VSYRASQYPVPKNLSPGPRPVAGGGWRAEDFLVCVFGWPPPQKARKTGIQAELGIRGGTEKRTRVVRGSVGGSAIAPKQGIEPGESGLELSVARLKAEDLVLQDIDPDLLCLHSLDQRGDKAGVRD